MLKLCQQAIGGVSWLASIASLLTLCGVIVYRSHKIFRHHFVLVICPQDGSFWCGRVSSVKALQTCQSGFLLLRLFRLPRVVVDEDVLLVLKEAVKKPQPV